MRGGAGVARDAVSARIGASSKYGGFPVSSSTTVAPTDQMSQADVRPSILITSGAIQSAVPTKLRVIARGLRSKPLTWGPGVVV